MVHSDGGLPHSCSIAFAVVITSRIILSTVPFVQAEFATPNRCCTLNAAAALCTTLFLKCVALPLTHVLGVPRAAHHATNCWATKFAVHAWAGSSHN